MIISCSRRTDIPAFYGDWFINRIREGFVLVRNPMNAKQVRRILLLPSDVDFIVFWTKNPAPFLDKLNFLQDYNYYFQFTLTPYDKDIEPNLPLKKEIIDSFLKLSNKIGSKRVIWRYDPILLSPKISIDYHIQKFGYLAQKLSDYTEKCIISFLDSYRHIQGRMSNLSIYPPNDKQARELAAGMVQIAKGLDIKVETCAEKIDLSELGIEHGKCIDDHLISQLTGRNLTMKKDKNQRELCGCIASVDIGEYNTCNHLCIYCYANVSSSKVKRNQFLHNVQSPLLIGGADGISSGSAAKKVIKTNLFE